MLTEIVLPTALGAIMLGIGMSLQTKDFVLLRNAPRPVLIGLLAQLLIMPLIALAIVWALPVTQDIALGILLLAACPGGTMSNAMSQLLRADLALSVSLTTLSTSLCIFTTPLLLNTTFSLFSDEITFTSSSMLAVSGRLLFIALLPVIAGMLFRRAFPMRALKMIPAFQRFAFVFLCLLIIVMVWREYETLVQTSGTLFGSVMMLIVLTSSAGFLIGRICNQSFRVCKTLCIETGIQNAAMAMVIAITILDAPALSVVSAVYGLFMYGGPLAVITVVHKFTPKLRLRDTEYSRNN